MEQWSSGAGRRGREGPGYGGLWGRGEGTLRWMCWETGSRLRLVRTAVGAGVGEQSLFVAQFVVVCRNQQKQAKCSRIQP